jgi:uncharacterized membrane protein
MATCRICFEPENLISVCNCDGTMKYVHKECIEKWIIISHRKNCELCHAPYTIHVERPIEWARFFYLAFGVFISIFHAFYLKKQVNEFPNETLSVFMLAVVVNSIHILLWKSAQKYGLSFQSMCISIWMLFFVFSSILVQWETTAWYLISMSYAITILCYILMVFWIWWKSRLEH